MVRHDGTVLMLPGRAYTCDMPLLACTTRALRATGWTVQQTAWDLTVLPDEPRVFVEKAAQALHERVRGPGPVVVVAKSLGTLAAHWAADQEYPAVWLTPILKAAGLHPLPDDVEALAARLRDYPAANLVVGGTADALWEPGFRGTGSVLEIAGADHGLEVADRGATARHHDDVAAAVVAFASGIS